MADGNLPPIESVFADPDFRRLSAPEKINALKRYPDFAELPPKEQVNAISIGLEKIPMATPGFWRTVGGELTGMAGAAWEHVRHPLDVTARDWAFRAAEIDKAVEAAREGRLFEAGHRAVRGALGPTGTAIAHSQLEQFRKVPGEVREALAPGATPLQRLTRAGSALGYAAAGTLPIVGPAGAQVGEELREGEWGPAGAHALMLLGPDVVSAGLGLTGTALGAATRGVLKSRLSGTQAARFAEAESRARTFGFPGTVVTRGEKLGSPVLQAAERMTRDVPGASGYAEEVFTKRAGELERQARESIGKVSPATPVLSEWDAGMGVHQEAGGTISGLRSRTRTIYTEVERRAATDTQTLPIGSRQLPNGTWQAITATYEAPIPLKPFRARLKPLYNEFRSQFKDLDESQRMANPGYASLHRIMTDVDELTGRPRMYMNAMDLDKELSAIKTSLRDRQFSSFLRSPSGRVQLRVINEGETLIGRKLDQVMPGTYRLLQDGRALVRQYSFADRIMTEVFGRADKLDPVKAYHALTRAGDYKFYQIQELAKIAPNTSKAVMRNALEGLMTEATVASGRLEAGGGRTLLAGKNNRIGWAKIGPKTKEALIGRQLANEIDTTFRNIDSLMPPVGSPTAPRLLAASGIVAVGSAALEALQMLVTGEPFTAAGVAGKAAATLGAANIAARILLSPGGGASVTRLVRAAHIGGAGLREAARAFEARVAVAQKEQRQEEEERYRAETGMPTAAAPPAGDRAGRPAPAAVVQAATGPALAPGDTRWGAMLRGGGTPGVASPTPPEGTTWEYWGLKPPAERKPGPFAPPVRPEVERKPAGPPPAHPRAAPVRATPVRPAAPPARPVVGPPAAGRPRAGAAPDARQLNWEKQFLPRTERFAGDFQRIGTAYGVPPRLLRAIAFMESGGNPNPRVTSPKHKERGLMQLMPEMARKLHADPNDPVQSIRAAAEILAGLMRKYKGEMWKVFAAYNEGEPNFDKHQRRGEDLPDITKRYFSSGLRLLRQGQVQVAAR